MKSGFLSSTPPAAPGGFEDRLDFIKDALAKGAAKFVRQHAQERCKSLDALPRRTDPRGNHWAARPDAAPARPRSTVAGRSTTLLKVKTFHDAEAGHNRPPGRRGPSQGPVGRAAPCDCRTAPTSPSAPASSDRERDNPPAIGATVTFRYQELSDGGVPRFPSWVGVRHDVAVKEPKPSAAAKKTGCSSDRRGQPGGRFLAISNSLRATP